MKDNKIQEIIDEAELARINISVQKRFLLNDFKKITKSEYSRIFTKKIDEIIRIDVKLKNLIDSLAKNNDLDINEDELKLYLDQIELAMEFNVYEIYEQYRSSIQYVSVFQWLYAGMMDLMSGVFHSDPVVPDNSVNNQTLIFSVSLNDSLSINYDINFNAGNSRLLLGEDGSN